MKIHKGAPPYPELKMMHEWNEELVRGIEYYEVISDRLLQRFDFKGPDGRTHHFGQSISPAIHTMLTPEQVVAKLKEHWEKTYVYP